MAIAEVPSFRLEAPALDGVDAQVRSVVGRERIAEPYRFVIELRVPGDAEVDLESLLQHSATLIFLRGDEERRRIHGAITSASDRSEPDANHTTWEIELGPRINDLSLNQRLEVHVDKAIPTIVRERLERAGLEDGLDFAIRLAGEFPNREFVVQYEESDLDFLRRLTENVGISFTFVHENDRDKLLVVDNNDAYPLLEDVPYQARESGSGIYRLSRAVRRLPSSYRVRDYNYQRPGLEIEAGAQIEKGAGGEIYEYGANVTSAHEAAAVARVRAEAILATRNVHNGESDWMPLRAGAICTIEGHPRGPMRVLIVEVEHDAEVTTLEGGEDEQTGYHNRFVAIPADVEYRPPRITPRPRVGGLLTGIVEGSGDGEYAHLDEHGRYRVRLLFDDSDTPAAHASLPMRMAQPHAGPGYGMHFPLRAGVEVLIACIDGDPDRPVIASTVPNAETPSPVTTANSAKNVIRTGGSNEIALDDTRGGQRIKLSTPHKDTVFQLGSPNAAEDGAITTTSGNTTNASKGTSSDFATMSFGLSAWKAATSGNVVTIAEKNAIEAIALTFEGLEKLAESVASWTKLARDQDSGQKDTINKDIEAQTEELNELKAKKLVLETLREEWEKKHPETPGADEQDNPETAHGDEAEPKSRHGGKHGGKHPIKPDHVTDDDVKKRLDHLEADDAPPSEEEIAALQTQIDAKKTEISESKEKLAFWEKKSQVAEVMEAAAAVAGGGAKLFSLIAQAKHLYSSGKAVAEIAKQAGEAQAALLATNVKPLLPAVPPYNIAVGEGTAALLGEKFGFVAAPVAAVFGEHTAVVHGAKTVVSGVTKAELFGGAEVLVHAGLPTFAEIELDALGEIEITSALKTDLKSQLIKVTGDVEITAQTNSLELFGDVTWTARGGRVGISATGVLSMDAAAAFTASSQALAKLSGVAGVTVDCDPWELSFHPDGVKLGGASPLPNIALGPEGLKLTSGAQGSYELNPAGLHSIKGVVVHVDARFLILDGEMVQLG